MNLALGFDFFPAEEVGSDELLKGLQREAAEITEVFDDGDSPALIEAAGERRPAAEVFQLVTDVVLHFRRLRRRSPKTRIAENSKIN